MGKTCASILVNSLNTPLPQIMEVVSTGRDLQLTDLPTDVILNIGSLINWQDRFKLENLCHTLRNSMQDKALRQMGIVDLSTVIDYTVQSPTQLLTSIVDGKKCVDGIIAVGGSNVRTNKGVVDAANLILKSDQKLKFIYLEGLKPRCVSAPDEKLEIISTKMMESLETLSIQSCQIQVKFNCLQMDLKELQLKDSTNVTFQGLKLNQMKKLVKIAIDTNQNSCLTQAMIEEAAAMQDTANLLNLVHLELLNAPKYTVKSILEKLINSHRNSIMTHLHFKKLILSENDSSFVDQLLTFVKLKELYICSCPSSLLASLVKHANEQLREITVGRYKGYELRNNIRDSLGNTPRRNSLLTVDVNNGYEATKNASVFDFGDLGNHFSQQDVIIGVLLERCNVIVNYHESLSDRFAGNCNCFYEVYESV